MEKKEKCSNCGAEVKKGIRLCPYCGHLNPTLKIKEIFYMIAVILIVSSIVIALAS